MLDKGHDTQDLPQYGGDPDKGVDIFDPISVFFPSSETTEEGEEFGRPRYLHGVKLPLKRGSL